MTTCSQLTAYTASHTRRCLYLQAAAVVYTTIIFNRVLLRTISQADMFRPHTPLPTKKGGGSITSSITREVEFQHRWMRCTKQFPITTVLRANQLADFAIIADSWHHLYSLRALPNPLVALMLHKASLSRQIA